MVASFPGYANQDGSFIGELNRTLHVLTSELQKRVLILGIVPGFGFDPNCEAKKACKPLVVKRCATHEYNEWIMKLILHHKNVEYYDLMSYVCNGEYCSSYDSVGNLLSEGIHLNNGGSRRLGMRVRDREGVPFALSKLLRRFPNQCAAK